MSAPGAGEYQARKWQIVTDHLGYENVYETNEDGGPGDLVAEAYGDARLIAASPALYEVAEDAVAIFDVAIDLWNETYPDEQDEVITDLQRRFREALALARGEAA